MGSSPTGSVGQTELERLAAEEGVAQGSPLAAGGSLWVRYSSWGRRQTFVAGGAQTPAGCSSSFLVSGRGWGDCVLGRVLASQMATAAARRKLCSPAPSSELRPGLFPGPSALSCRFKGSLTAESLFPPALPATGSRYQAGWGEPHGSARSLAPQLPGFCPLLCLPLAARPTSRPRISGSRGERLLIDHHAQWSSVEMFGTLEGPFGGAAVPDGDAKDATDPGTGRTVLPPAWP